MPSVKSNIDERVQGRIYSRFLSKALQHLPFLPKVYRVSLLRFVLKLITKYIKG
jgi:hypothetical protein